MEDKSRLSPLAQEAIATVAAEDADEAEDVFEAIWRGVLIVFYVVVTTSTSHLRYVVVVL